MLIVALPARRVDSFGREHDSGRCARATGSPGLVIDVGIAVAVTGAASDVLSGVGHGNLFLCEIQMADMATTIVGTFDGSLGFGVVLKEQERLLILLGSIALPKHQQRQEKASECDYQAGIPHASRLDLLPTF